jgi:histidine triad (HIT) family protein
MPGLFMKIIQGEIPCYKIYEDEFVFAFLARDQIQPGHTLVIPKVEVDYFLDVEEPHYSRVFQAAKPLSRAIQKATGCKRIGMTVLGLEVPHFHLHLVPLEAEGDLSFSKARVLKGTQMEAIRDKILAALQAQNEA